MKKDLKVLKNFAEEHKEAITNFKGKEGKPTADYYNTINAALDNFKTATDTDSKKYGWKRLNKLLLSIAAEKGIDKKARREALVIAGMTAYNYRNAARGGARAEQLQRRVDQLKRGDLFIFEYDAQIVPDTNADTVYVLERGECIVFDGEYKNAKEDLAKGEMPIETYPLRFTSANSNVTFALAAIELFEALVDIEVNAFELGINENEDGECNCPNCRAKREEAEPKEDEDEIARAVVDAIGDTLDRLGKTLDRLGETLDRLGETLDRLGDTLDRLGKTGAEVTVTRVTSEDEEESDTLLN